MIYLKIKRANNKFYGLIEEANGRYPIVTFLRKEKSTIKGIFKTLIKHGLEAKIKDLTIVK